MKISVWWLLALPVLIAGIASSQAGFRVVWDYEMKTPEAQKAVADFIYTHCYTQPVPFVEDKAPATGRDLNQLKLHCWVDEHQK